MGEKTQTEIFKNAGYDLRVTVPSSSSVNWVWLSKHEALCQADLAYIH